MNKREIGKYNSYAQVGSAFETHAAVYKDHVQFKKGAGDFFGYLDRLDELSIKQTTRTDGVSADKAQALHLLGDCAYRIASAIAACAHDAGNNDLAGRVAYSRSQITRGPDAVVIARGKGLHAAGLEYLEPLDEYGVTAADLTTLKKKTEAFQSLQPKPRRVKASASAATRELKNVVGQVDTLLAEKLDKLVIQFKDSAPDFYHEYTSARILVVSPVTQKREKKSAEATESKKESNPKAADEKPAANKTA